MLVVANDCSLVLLNSENMTNVATTRLRDIVEGKQEYPVKTKKFWLPELDVIAPFVQKELEEHFKKMHIHDFQSKSLECGMATGCVKIVNKAFEFDHLGKFIPAHKRAKDVDLFRGDT